MRAVVGVFVAGMVAGVVAGFTVALVLSSASESEMVEARIAGLEGDLTECIATGRDALSYGEQAVRFAWKLRGPTNVGLEDLDLRAGSE